LRQTVLHSLAAQLLEAGLQLAGILIQA